MINIRGRYVQCVICVHNKWNIWNVKFIYDGIELKFVIFFIISFHKRNYTPFCILFFSVFISFPISFMFDVWWGGSNERARFYVCEDKDIKFVFVCVRKKERKKKLKNFQIVVDSESKEKKCNKCRHRLDCKSCTGEDESNPFISKKSFGPKKRCALFWYIRHFLLKFDFNKFHSIATFDGSGTHHTNIKGRKNSFFFLLLFFLCLAALSLLSAAIAPIGFLIFNYLCVHFARRFDLLIYVFRWQTTQQQQQQPKTPMRILQWMLRSL